MQKNTTPQSLVLKLRFEDDIRRIRLDDPKNLPFEELQQLIGSLFVDTPMSSILLKYEDEDGDKLSITSTIEWQEAIRYFFASNLPHFTLLLTSRAPVTAQTSNNDALGDIAVALLKGAFQGLGIEAELKIQPRKEETSNPPRTEIRHPQPRHVGGCHRRAPGPHGVCHRPAAVRARLCRRMQEPVDESAGCTYSATGRRYARHSAWFNCVTCGLVGMEGCCVSCANTCHKGHELVHRGPCPSFFCDCGAGAHGVVCSYKKEAESKETSPQKEEEKTSSPSVVARLRLPSRYQQQTLATTTTPLIPLRIIKKEESLPSSSSTADVSESTEATEKKVNNEGNNNDENNKVEETKEGEETSLEDKVEELVTMGFEDREQNMAALVAHEGDLNSAIIALLNIQN